MHLPEVGELRLQRRCLAFGFDPACAFLVQFPHQSDDARIPAALQSVHNAL